MRPSALLKISDPVQALDFDMALTIRARYELQAQIREANAAMDDDAGFGGFCTALLMVLTE